SYPHCWRCKQPVIFRATEQWFVSVSHQDLREKMLGEIGRVGWIPGWGQARIRTMVEQRPDWCISRQRVWGIPIPAFYCEKCGEVILSRETVLAVRDYFAEHGSNSWFTTDASEILPEGYACGECGGNQFRKETDIFDVWFESGSSHRSVVKHGGFTWPADLYLEGTDQHRGWFQLSLLTATAADGAAPFRTVLTHGFVVDEKGEKMSKSLGNFISVADVLKRFGGDIFRLWVSSVDYRQDINLSFDIIAHLSSGYRRIRNTIRYVLGNLNDFDPGADRVDAADMPEIDRWAGSRTQSLLGQCRAAYESYEFHRVYHLVHNFCAVDMSSFYLDILKDRLYASPAKSLERRSAQTVLCGVLDVLIKVLAPILVYSVEDAWKEARQHLGGAESPHLELLPEVDDALIDTDLEGRWARLSKVRDEVAREIEKLRNAGEVKSSLEASVVLHTTDADLLGLLTQYEAMLSEVFIVSEVELAGDEPAGAAPGVDIAELRIMVKRSAHTKCERCWNLRESVGADPEYPDICERCATVVRG
ncbi:MAG: class I tRNA ligase family protein, partial [Planctomycetes bacterium]|nr:class I tRNA ligase family protein [Planctomycetota bacterium]